jgi:rhodanese-related sulfurtransferase
MSNIEDTIVETKDRLPDITPTPPKFHPEATAAELKARLQWGEPGLTILDVRDHSYYNECRIQGAINMPLADLPDMATGQIQPERDIYVYGNSEEETQQGISLLSQAGYQKVAQLKGGLQAWVEIDGQIEGVIVTPGADAYNVVARLDAFSKERAKEKSLK